MASSPPSPANTELSLPPSAAESQLFSLIHDLSGQVQGAMENMLKMIKLVHLTYQFRATVFLWLLNSNMMNISDDINCQQIHKVGLVVKAWNLKIYSLSSEIEQSSSEIFEEIGKCRNGASERKKTLEDEKEHFQKAAYAVIDMLHNREIS